MTNFDFSEVEELLQSVDDDMLIVPSVYGDTFQIVDSHERTLATFVNEEDCEGCYAFPLDHFYDAEEIEVIQQACEMMEDIIKEGYSDQQEKGTQVSTDNHKALDDDSEEDGFEKAFREWQNETIATEQSKPKESSIDNSFFGDDIEYTLSLKDTATPISTTKVFGDDDSVYIIKGAKETVELATKLIKEQSKLNGMLKLLSQKINSEEDNLAKDIDVDIEQLNLERRHWFQIAYCKTDIQKQIDLLGLELYKKKPLKSVLDSLDLGEEDNPHDDSSDKGLDKNYIFWF